MTRRKPRRRPAPKRRADPALGKSLDLTVERIGHAGDGIGRFHDHPVYIPFALPGDRLTVRLTERRGEGYVAEATAETARKIERETPPCSHFECCGGCQLQHLPTEDYRHWKQTQVENALGARGFTDIDIKPLIPGHPAARRRLRLAFDKSGKNIQLGLRARQSRAVIPISHCPITAPAITDRLKALQTLLAELDMASEGGELQATTADNGLDLLLQTPTPPGLADLERLTHFAESQDLARLAWRPDAATQAEPLAARRPVQIKMGGIPVDLPIGAFLQATEEAETAIRAAITEAIGDAHSIIDLFAGCGAFSLPFAAKDRDVTAIERDQAMIQALKNAARRAGLEPKLKAEARDLDRNPLLDVELQKTDAVILDPPRAGALNQCRGLARSDVPRLAMVSCNPATFARDARLLADGGYHLTAVQPIDAFLWSTEIELIGAFQRQLPP